jgi:hypothetical protein
VTRDRLRPSAGKSWRFRKVCKVCKMRKVGRFGEMPWPAGSAHLAGVMSRALLAGGRPYTCIKLKHEVVIVDPMTRQVAGAFSW